MGDDEQPEADAARTDVAAGQDSLHLIYKIEGKPNEVDVFELARVLESFGNVLKESYKVTHPGNETELNVAVQPFQPGSFVMDIALHVQQNPTYLFFLSHPEIVAKAKETLEYLGFIKKIGEKGLSLLELVKKLKGEKPEKIDKKPEGGFEYKAKDGSVMPVESEVHHLYNNSTVNHYTYNIFVPAEKPNVEGILTSLKGQPDSARHFDKQDVAAVRSYSAPSQEPEKVEVLDETTTKWLAPKSGNYGQVRGKWKFTMVGTKRTIEAKISDAQFLTHYANGEVRFYQGDRIKVRLREKQIIEGSKSKMEYDIVEVLEYNPQQAVPGM